MIYYKIINNQIIKSDCKVIKLNGHDVSNPTPEMIAEAGWQVYVPPIIPPQPQTDPDFSQVMAAVKKMLSTETEELSDEDALDVAALFPTWVSKVGQQVSAGERLWYDGKLYKVVQAHTASSEWVPDHNPALYTEVSIEEIPAWRQPVGSVDAYMTGDKVKHNGRTWESLVDNNVWEPGTTGTEDLWQDITPNS